MNINMNKKITGIKKEVIKNGELDLTIKDAVLMALVIPNPDRNGSTPEESLKTRKLFDKIDESVEYVDLKSEEIVKLKEIVAKRLSEIVAGSVILALEPE